MSSVSLLRQRMASRNMSSSPSATRAVGGGTFVPDDVLASLGSMDQQQADALDFGVMQLSDSGHIHLYNRYQGEIGNLTPSQAEGKHFFTEIAPCTNNNIFHGQFRKGVAADNLNVMLSYTFNYRLAPIGVNVHMYRDPSTRTNWIFVQRA